MYAVSFHGNLAPATGASLPETLTLTLQQDGVAVPDAIVQHTFQTATDTASVSFTAPVQVTNAPSTLNIVGEGGDFLYSAVSMSVYKIG